MIAAIIQARMGSTRLPGKVMMEAAGKPILGLFLERLAYCKTLDQVIVATSTDPRDDVIATYAKSLTIPVFRGSENDVLDRYYQAALEYRVDPVVRITSDCPLIDPVLVDEMVTFAIQHRDEFDLVTNRHPLTFPDGLDVDVMPLASLKLVWEKATTKPQREHVIPYFWEAGMRVHNVEQAENLFRSQRWTLDYPEDFALIKTIFEALYKPGELFTTQQILDYLAAHPEVQALNAQYLPIEQ